MSFILRKIDNDEIIYWRATAKFVFPISWKIINTQDAELDKEYDDSRAKHFMTLRGIRYYVFK